MIVRPNHMRRVKVYVVLFIILAGSLATYITWKNQKAHVRITSNVPAKVYTGGTSYNIPGTITLPTGPVDLTVYIEGYVASTIHADLPRGDSSLDFELARDPAGSTELISEFATWAGPNPNNNGVIYLGNRGSAIMEYSPGGGELNLTGNILNNVSCLNWSKSGTAVIRTESTTDSEGDPPVTTLYDRSSNRIYSVPCIVWGGTASIQEDSICFGDYNGTKSTVHRSKYYVNGSTAKLKDTKVYTLKQDLMVPTCYLSPDGRKVAFTPMPISTNQAEANLYLMDLADGEVTGVFTEGYVTGVKWSPGSRYLLFEYRKEAPVVYSYDTERGGFTPLKIPTFIEKVAFYDDTTIIYGLPYQLDKTLAAGASTPDSLMYGSCLSEASGVIIPCSTKTPCNYTCPVLSNDKKTLYYLQSLYLMKVDIDQVIPVIKRFSNSVGGIEEGEDNGPEAIS